jgi:hypothetical protein
MEYTLSLALVDYLPVAFTALGLFYIVRMVGHVDTERGRVAALGAVLTVAGGLAKATWKLIMALSRGSADLVWLDNSLFILMTPGYILLAYSVWQTMQQVRGRATRDRWRPPLVFIALVFVAAVSLALARPDSPAWERVLLSVMVLATVVTGVLLIVFSFRQRLPLPAWLFILNLVGVFMLNGMARIPEQTIPLQWIEQSINAVAWLAFAYAAARVYAHARARFGVDAGGTAQPVAP